MSASVPEFSVIIPTYNRLPALRRCLEALVRLDYPRERFEVIVVDDGSTAPVADAVLRPELNLTVRRVPNAGPARARNLGAECARGRYLAFTDDDCTPTPTWLRALENGATASPGAALGGRTINALPDNLCSTLSQLVVDVAYTCYNSDPARRGSSRRTTWPSRPTAFATWAASIRASGQPRTGTSVSAGYRAGNGSCTCPTPSCATRIR